MLSSIKIVVGLLLAGYALICLLLYLAQRSMIYHPQPRSQLSVAVLDLRHAGVVLKVSHLPRKASHAVLYFGGNAEDVSASVPQLSLAFPDAAIYALHYRAFGGSEGQPSEQALFADALALHAMAQSQHSHIIVVGRSLGSGVASYLGSQRPAERLILITPFSSIADIASSQFPWIPVRMLLHDHFDSVQYVAQTRAPVRIISALHDEVIPAWSTQRLFEAIPPALRTQHVIHGVGHNDISESAQYMLLLQKP